MDDDSLPHSWPFGAGMRVQPVESWTGDITTNVEYVTFPIVQLQALADGWFRSDKEEFGTCFFIARGLFLTAWHVVKDSIHAGVPMSVLLLRSGAETPPSLSYTAESVQWVRRLFEPSLAKGDEPRATDIAIGMASVPDDFTVPCWPLGTRPLPPGSPIVTHGFAGTDWQSYESERGEPALAVNLKPRFYRGTIADHVPTGRGITPWPIFVHDVDGGGGISGGPMIDVETGAVRGVNGTGMPGVYATAADISYVLDSPFQPGGELTLRLLSSRGIVAIR